MPVSATDLDSLERLARDRAVEFTVVGPEAPLALGIVDRFRVVVFPVITGATGKERIFDGYPDVALELVERRTFDGRLQLLEYVPTVLDGPPGSGA